MQQLIFISTAWVWLALGTAAHQVTTPNDEQLLRETLNVHHKLQSFGGAITALNLIEARFDTVFNLVDNMVIPSNYYNAGAKGPNYNIDAVVSGPEVKSVLYSYNTTRVFKIENGAPFAFCGNTGQNFPKCTKLGLGTHTVTATPYSALNARGVAGTPMTVTFDIRPSDEVAPAIVTFTATPMTVDVTNGPATVQVDFLVQDASGIMGGDLSVYPPNALRPNMYFNPTYKYGQEYVVPPRPLLGPNLDQPVPVSITAQFPQYLAPGSYLLYLHASDPLLNSFHYGRGPNITVTNSNPDTQIPTLASFKPLFDHTKRATSTLVKFEIIVSDNLSGIKTETSGGIPSSSLELFCGQCPNGSNNLVQVDFESRPNLTSGQPHTFIVPVSIPDDLYPQCQFVLSLSDKAGNQKTYYGRDLKNKGFPGFWNHTSC